MGGDNICSHCCLLCFLGCCSVRVGSLCCNAVVWATTGGFWCFGLLLSGGLPLDSTPHRLMWCFWCQPLQCNLEGNCDTLWWQKQLKQSFPLFTMSKRFCVSRKVSQHRDPSQNTRALLVEATDNHCCLYGEWYCSHCGWSLGREPATFQSRYLLENGFFYLLHYPLFIAMITSKFSAYTVYKEVATEYHMNKHCVKQVFGLP